MESDETVKAYASQVDLYLRRKRYTEPDPLDKAVHRFRMNLMVLNEDLEKMRAAVLAIDPHALDD